MGIFRAFPKEPALPPQAAPVKTEKAAWVNHLPHISCNLTTLQRPACKPEKQPKDFDLHKGSDFKRAETKLREKPAAEKGWKQDVSNPPLSRSDLAGRNPDEGFAQAATPQRMA
ncbi:hypothetical protein [Desulfitobacterium chlororespirans]|uniref:hypothetical protein n=1 Tax=Desulfitobacterium chlororespirans TaxID=51616 RepID=UPI000A7F7457|nr:hypothetical protein [Desulfitobacterium chlororespirans]